MEQVDLIDRQAAIDALNGIASDLHARKRLDEEYIASWCAETIEQLPSAQPCYKTDHGYMWLCPKCGLAVHSDYDRCVRCGWERITNEGD